MDIEEIDESHIIMNSLKFTEWHCVLLEAMALGEEVENHLDTFPDTSPFFGLSERFEDLQSLITSLYVFYVQTTRTCRIEPK